MVVSVELGHRLQEPQEPQEPWRFFPVSHGLATIQREKATMARAMGSW
jgi:hypothetical protein